MSAREHRAIPGATCRLQLHAGFTLDDAADLAPYLRDLGATHVYLSPILGATPGSTHGYDVVDPTRLDDERGGEAAFERLRTTCVDLGLGLVLDVVPNHLAVGTLDNPWWLSVLRLGRASPHATAFDIDWDAPGAGGRVIRPVLGDALEHEIDAGSLTLAREGGALRARYFDHAWPLRPRTVSAILRAAADGAEDAGARAALVDLADAFAGMEREPGADPERAALEAEARLADACARDASIAGAIDGALAEHARPDRLGPIMDEQHYLPMFWRDGVAALNYRRFFDIDTLAGVRVEDPAIFEATHARILDLAAREGVEGLRIDHPDGLRDPKGYFDRLTARAQSAWIVAEKILHPDEALRSDWPVAGTTGYEALNDILGVLIEQDAEPAMTDLYAELTGRDEPFARVEHEARLKAAMELLAPDRARLTRLARTALGDAQPPADGTGDERLSEALADLAAAMSVYRTYLVPERGEVAAEDRRILQAAAHNAGRSRPDPGSDQSAGPIDALCGLMLDPGSAPGDAGAARELAARFQQYTAPTAAKGVEDTALYRYNRFVALNEVGGEPSRFGLAPQAFHGRMRARAERWPGAMTTTSTHDTKRSEDVRARLCVLSEAPDRWAACAREWMQRTDELGSGGVDPNDRYLLLQTLVGAWPIEPERAGAYMTKAMRESKVHTAWTSVNEAYERSVEGLIDAVMADETCRAAMQRVADAIRGPGRVKSLSQTLVKLACPGVPDVYQGCELWDLSLVDPDNRRAVDFQYRRDLCARLEAMPLGEVWASLDDPNDPGLAKLWLTRAGLGVRRRVPEAFGPGSGYEPLRAMGDGGAPEDGILAFVRTDGDGRPRVAAIAPRLVMRELSGATIELPEPPEGVWTNLCTGAAHEPGGHAAADLLGGAPVALLTDGYGDVCGREPAHEGSAR